MVTALIALAVGYFGAKYILRFVRSTKRSAPGTKHLVVRHG